MPTMKLLLDAWKALVRLVVEFVGRLWAFFRKEKKGGRDFWPACCITPPDTIRARTDPYIYSQDWLSSRGIAVVWDNPDFSLRDAATGAVVPGDILQPDTLYHVDVTVHNHSQMAAIATQVLLEWHKFGSSLPSTMVGTKAVNIPAIGSAVVSFDWKTPGPPVHICLDAILTQADDANPLNNVGQHNVHIFGAGEPDGRVVMDVGNQARDARTYEIVLDSYRLPAVPLHPGPPAGKLRLAAGDVPSRDGLAYLQALQAANDARRFPVPDALAVRVSDNAPRVGRGESREIVVEFDPAAAVGRIPINVNVIHEGRLMGGVTFYTGKAQEHAP
jgi:hypothetical protein